MGGKEYPSSLRVLLPTMGGWYFLLVLACFLYLEPLRLLWDGGTCRHIENGLLVLVGHQIPATNYQSALFANTPCLTHALLGDIAYGIAFYLWRLNGVVLLAAAVLALAFTWTYQWARMRGLGAVATPILSVLVLTACSLHWSARSHLFSYLAFLLVYYLHFLAKAANWQKLWLTSLLIFIWANMHGSFLLGLFLVAVKCVSDWIEACWSHNPSLSQVKWDLATIVFAGAAACLNLRGFGLLNYVGSYLLHPMILLRSDEWRSLDFGLGIQTWSFLLIYMILIGLWALAPIRAKLSDFLPAMLLFLAGIYSMRLIPYAAMIAFLAMGPAFSAWKDQFVSGQQAITSGAQVVNDGWKRCFTNYAALEERVAKAEERCGQGPSLYLLIALAMSVIFVALPYFKIVDFDPRHLPVKAVTYVKKQHLNGLAFNYDNWGRYMHWRLQHGVFIDDATDFYPLSFLQAYVACMMGQAGWQNVLDQYQIQYVLIPRQTLLGAALLASPQWKLVYQDDLSDLYIRNAKLHAGHLGKSP